MAENKFFEKIEKIEELGNGKSTTEKFDSFVERTPPNKEKFDNLVRVQTSDIATATPVKGDETKHVSLMDEVRNLNSRVDQMKKVTPKELAQQAEGMIAQIEDIKGKLNEPNQTLKKTSVNLLNNKLTHIDDSLRVALEKAGLEYKVPDKHVSLANPIDRFFGMLTHGQNQLQNLANEIRMWHHNNVEISPANMLAIQIKVGFMTQELEFFTSVLNKALESTKTIMNVQV